MCETTRKRTTNRAAETHDTTTCPECEGHVHPDGHEQVCVECGLVVATDAIDHGAEWRQFPDDNENSSRVGSPRTVARHDNGLSTKIGQGPAPDSQTRRLRREHNRSKTPTKRDRNRMHGFVHIRRVCSALDVSTAVRDEACSLFADAQDAALLQGRSIERVAGASIYAAARITGTVLVPADVADRVPSVETIELLTTVRTLVEKLDVALPWFTATDHVPRMASALDLDQQTTSDALALAREAEQERVAQGRSPTGVAAACVYATSGLTQKAIADEFDVTTNTIRAARDDLRDVGLL